MQSIYSPYLAFFSPPSMPERLRIQVSRISMADYEQLNYDKDRLRGACKSACRSLVVGGWLLHCLCIGVMAFKLIHKAWFCMYTNIYLDFSFISFCHHFSLVLNCLFYQLYFINWGQMSQKYDWNKVLNIKIIWNSNLH